MTRILRYNPIMNILLITDLYPVKSTENTTPKTLLNFVKEWEKQGYKVDVIKPNFILNSFLRGKPFYKTGKYGNVYNVNYWTPFLGRIEAARKLGSEAARSSHAPSPDGEGWDGVISSDDSENSQRQQTDKNHSTLQPFNYSTNTPPSPQPSPSRGEGACDDSLSTFNFPLSTENNLPSYPPTFQSSIILAHMPSGILFSDKLGLPFVAGIHVSDLIVLTSPLYAFHFRKRMIKALKNAKAIACRSFVIKKKLLKLFPEFENKTFVAPSGIDEGIVAEGWRSRGLEVWQFNNSNNNKISQKQQTNNSHTSIPLYLHTSDNNTSTLKVLTCAHFKKRKNIDKLIMACKGLEGVELTVIGDGKIRQSLEKIDKNVIFTGQLEPEKVLEKMRESDVFILPSVDETFGMVYLEAMASGCITVCTEDDGISGIINDGENGFLVKPDVESIRKIILKIQNLTANDIQTILQNTFDTISQYTSEKVAENYLSEAMKFLSQKVDSNLY